MRGLVLSGFAALAISTMAPATVWAWSTEQPSTTSAAGAAALAEHEDPLKILQDKVDAKTSAGQTGFYVSGGAAQASGPFGFYSSQTTEKPFGYSPMPGFRGQPQ